MAGVVDRFRRTSGLDSEFVINPPGSEKMSDVLEAFLEPYLDVATTLSERNKLAALAAAAWNASLMSAPKRKEFLDDVLTRLPVEVHEDTMAIVEELIERKQAFFAENRRYIIRTEVNQMGDGYHLTVVSVLKPLPDE